jgi:hypothetical protein|nr:MAG TPA: hypothetical protein [Caudoviricetes sp.]
MRYILVRLKQLDGKTDLLKTYFNSRSFKDFKIEFTKDAVELYAVWFSGTREEVTKNMVDKIKIDIESQHGRSIIYTIRRVMM